MGKSRNVRNGLETQNRFSCGFECVSTFTILYKKIYRVRKLLEAFSLLRE